MLDTDFHGYTYLKTTHSQILDDILARVRELNPSKA